METDIDAELVSMLSLGMPKSVAAYRAGCHRNTVTSRLKDPEFRARLQAFKDMIEEAPKVLKTLYDVLGTLRASSSRLAAIDTVDVEHTAAECKRRLDEAVRWLEEWCWLLECDLETVPRELAA